MNDDKISFDLRITDEHGIDIGKLNTVEEVVKYVNESGYVKISGSVSGLAKRSLSFELTLNYPDK